MIEREWSEEIRTRWAADLDPCVRVLAEVHARDGYPVNWPEHPECWLAPEPFLSAFVVSVDDAVVGHAALSGRSEGDLAPGLWSARTGANIDDVAVVSRFFVAPTARGSGVAARLLAYLVAVALQRGLTPVLDVVASDASAVALYERSGWALLGAAVGTRTDRDRTVLCRSASGRELSPTAQRCDRYGMAFGTKWHPLCVV